MLGAPGGKDEDEDAGENEREHTYRSHEDAPIADAPMSAAGRGCVDGRHGRHGDPGRVHLRCGLGRNDRRWRGGERDDRGCELGVRLYARNDRWNGSGNHCGRCWRRGDCRSAGRAEQRPGAETVAALGAR